MIFTTYGRSMMYQVCGAMFAHVGDFCSRSNQPGDDTKDPVRTDDDFYAWSNWRTAKARLWRLRQPAPPLEFPGEHGILSGIYAQVREEEQVISFQFIGSQQDVSTRRIKSGSKSMTLLLLQRCQLCIGVWLFPAEDEVRAGDV